MKTHISKRNNQNEKQANNSPKAMPSIEGLFLRKFPNTTKSVTSGHISVDVFLKISTFDSNWFPADYSRSQLASQS